MLQSLSDVAIEGIGCGVDTAECGMFIPYDFKENEPVQAVTKQIYISKFAIACSICMNSHY